MARVRVGRLFDDTRGVSAIEFAILAPVLVTLLFGTLDFGRMLYIRQGMQSAMEQALRFYMLTPNSAPSTVTQTLQSAMVAGVGSQLVVSYADTANCNGSTATCTTITVTYPYQFAAGFLGKYNKTLTAKGQVVRWL